MFSGFPFLITGIIFFFLYRENNNDGRIDLKILNFWKSFEEEYPKELIDELPRNFNMESFYKLSNTDAYKKLSEEESAELVNKLNRYDELHKNLESHLKLRDIYFYVTGGSIGIFIFSIFLYSVN